jgi:soluble lytic murein transglycosylase
MKRKKTSALWKKFVLFILIMTVLVTAAGVTGVKTRFPVHYLEYVRAHAGELDPSWVMAVILAESGFNPRALSPAGARGLMQLMPETAHDVARRMGMRDFNPEDLWDPYINIAMGCFYLNERLRGFNGDIRLALAAYNGGQGNVRSWLANPEFSRDGKTLDVIPFTETYHYINRVVFNQRVYAYLLRFHKQG